MIKSNKTLNLILALVVAIIILESCGRAEGNFTGTEFMPDMAHSVAYEANYYNYYYLNTWDDESVFKLKDLSNPREPVPGTVARGYIGYASGSMGKTDALVNGTYNNNAIKTPPNGSVPYYYGDNDEERARAIAEIIENPFPITTAGLESGKELYTYFCGICHGEKGDGAGYLARDGSPYPAAPANFLLPTFRDTSNGVYYHSIMYGKNVMGGYADKISYEERWQIIHYIRALQAKEFKAEYSADANTLNNVEIPAAAYVSKDNFMAPREELPEIFKMGHGGEHGSDHGQSNDGESHGDDHSHEEGEAADNSQEESSEH